MENPYWQFFCGFEFFQHEAPIDASTITRWRKRIGPAGGDRSGHFQKPTSPQLVNRLLDTLWRYASQAFTVDGAWGFQPARRAFDGRI